MITNDPACGTRCERSTYGVSYPFLFPADGKLDPEKLPSLTVTGLSGLDMGPYPGYWSGYTYAVHNNMTKVVSSHTVKWGFTVERSGQDDQIQGTTASAPATNNQNGAFRFLDTGHPQATGLSIANMLLGNFNDYSEFGAKPNTPFVATMFDAFVQDSWRATQRLTLEVGRALLALAGVEQQVEHAVDVPRGFLRSGSRSGRGPDGRFHRERRSIQRHRDAGRRAARRSTGQNFRF